MDASYCLDVGTLRGWPGALVTAGSLKPGFLWPWVEAPWGGRSLAGEWGATQGLNLKYRDEGENTGG